ncbi:hypothetical protein DB346_23015 [Verrucomicrobia bacterium LW23]|nr:hypothetical protein DB346_23015 [Verrucomicrobia bacterium LW23]
MEMPGLHRNSARRKADHMRADLVTAALQQALGSLPRAHPAAVTPPRRTTYRPSGADAGCGTSPQLIFHSDRGSQHSSAAFRNLLARHNIAFTESFIGTLKTEMLSEGSFLNAHDAKLEIFEFIEMYDHNSRKHSSLNYKTANPPLVQKTVAVHFSSFLCNSFWAMHKK